MTDETRKLAIDSIQFPVTVEAEETAIYDEELNWIADIDDCWLVDKVGVDAAIAISNARGEYICEAVNNYERLRAEVAILSTVVDQIDAQGFWSGKFNSNAALVRILDEHKNMAEGAKLEIEKLRRQE